MAIETIGIAGFFLGILGNVIARHGDPAGKSLAEIILSRSGSGKPHLPPNHDLERVCRSSLKQTLELMAQAMDLHLTQPKTLVEAFKHRFDKDGKWKPMIEWWHTDEKAWFEEFVCEFSSPDGLSDFDLEWVTGASSLNDPLRNLKNPALEKQFSEAALAWLSRHVQNGKAPDFLEKWVREGWPIAQDSPTVRISLFQGWSLFLQHHFKEDSKVEAILTADWLASIDARLVKLPLTGEQLSAALKEPLGEHAQLLTQLRDSVQQLAAGYVGMEARTGQLFALVLEFRSEVGDGFIAVRAQLDATAVKLEVIATEVTASGRKLDASLLNDAQILTKLNELLAAHQHPVPHAPTSGQKAPVTKRIAESELLKSEGAQRFKKLVGRLHKKGMLARAWKDDDTKVLFFVAWGGVGKTSLVTDWLTDFVKNHWEGVDAFFDWSFYSQGTRDQNTASSETFFNAALRHFGETDMAASPAPLEEKAARLAAAMGRQRTLLILDGLEPLQHPRKPGQDEGRLKDVGIRKLLQSLAQTQTPGLCVVTTRVPVIDLVRFHGSSV